MKSYTFVIFIVACLVVQDTWSAPDMQEKAQEALDKVKAKAHEVATRAEEAASKAMESAKSTVHETLESAQQAAQHGVEAGHEWIEYGKNAAASFSNQTFFDKEGK